MTSSLGSIFTRLPFLWFSELSKQEREDEDFTPKKTGLKRKRVKDEPMEGPSDFAAKP